MRIGILQFSPELGDLSANLSRADSLLDAAAPRGIDLLVLPELAFTGYNFLSLSAISPHLEPTAAGPSTEWANRTAARLRCVVCVGYPERYVADSLSTDVPASDTRDERGRRRNYNSLVTVSPDGEILAHYRKTHLYYTDELWAEESPTKWLTTDLPLRHSSSSSSFSSSSSSSSSSRSPQSQTKTAFAICMDLNPHKFTAPWESYELATHARSSGAELLVCSMAWLSRLEREELLAEDVRELPDTETVGYWLGRLQPLCGARDELGKDDGEDGNGGGGGAKKEVVVVLANRCGEEEGGARYAGSSCVLGVGGMGREVRLWGVMGRGVEGLLVVDTGEEAGWRISGGGIGGE